MKRKYKILLCILAVLIVGTYFGVTGIKSYLRTIESNLNQLVLEKISDVDLSNMADGIYVGSHKVFPVDVEVMVFVKDHKISNIELIRHRNGKGSPAEAITGKVVESQTLQMDAIAGATYSSKVILKAIEKALIEAGGTKKDAAAQATLHCDCE